ncbi:Cytochrome c biogenesis ATP-binding export protein CcmA [Nymphon striatum]|nr:Cytochrome c biogenesis ATP-binding export protein CcmA [Nymphon striatum]
MLVNNLSCCFSNRCIFTSVLDEFTQLLMIFELVSSSVTCTGSIVWLAPETSLSRSFCGSFSVMDRGVCRVRLLSFCIQTQMILDSLCQRFPMQCGALDFSVSSSIGKKPHVRAIFRTHIADGCLRLRAYSTFTWWQMPVPGGTTRKLLNAFWPHLRKRKLMQLIAQNLACNRGDTRIFEGVSFSLRAGEGMLIVGPNGAGKSTLLRVIAGFLTPSEGSVVLEKGEITEQCQYLGPENAMKPALSVAENMNFWRHYMGDCDVLPLAALERVGLGHVLNVPFSELSTGQKRRVAIARLFVSHRPICGEAILATAFTLLIGTPAITFIGAVGAAVAVSLPRGGLLVSVVTHGMINTPYTGDLPLIDINRKLADKKFDSMVPILCQFVEELIHKGLVVANPVTEKIFQNIDDIHSVADMAAICNLSARQLQRTLKQTTGFTPHDFLKVLRLQQALNGEPTLSYADQSHFIHSFRKATGYTPGKYAKKFDELKMTQMNAVGWFDIFVDDLDRASAFYGTVLGRALEAMGDPTGETQMMSFPADMGVYGAAGALTKSEHGKPGVGGTIVYFSVEDCAVNEARVIEAGGIVIRPKFSIGEFGWVTLCQDTEGNMFDDVKCAKRSQHKSWNTDEANAGPVKWDKGSAANHNKRCCKLDTIAANAEECASNKNRYNV